MRSRASRPRVVIAGLGDTGLLTAIRLAPHADVVGVSPKPGLVSGQELGLRLTRPEEWARDYWISFDRFRRLDGVRIVHGTLVGLDLDGHTVSVESPDGSRLLEPFDALVISTGVTNGFWRRPDVESAAQLEAAIRETHRRVADAESVIVIGGGAAAVSAAFNTAATWPGKRVDLHFPGEIALPEHHPRVWRALKKRLRERGVGLHPGHRAEIPDGFDGGAITSNPVRWSTGQPDAKADAVLWAIGRVRPNTGWLPPELLDAHGFVRVDQHLRVGGRQDVFAIGDVAATDRLRSSARARADGVLAHNVRAALDGGRLRAFKPAPRRWGSVVGAQDNVLEVFSPQGRAFTLPAWSTLQPFVVRRGIYKGIRPADGASS
ncbi:MAG TPA: FAD-dependent oxidoreductase [Aeromicrobium sp.]|nr:FAD-dependent oxidoreductase [Aeromicrobium sp.]